MQRVKLQAGDQVEKCLFVETSTIIGDLRYNSIQFNSNQFELTPWNWGVFSKF